MKKITFDPKYDNVPVTPIGLKKWLEEHPSPRVGKRMSQRAIDMTLNSTQEDHLRGELDVYAPIEAYKQQWTKGTRYNPITKTVGLAPAPIGPRIREDLPPIYIQWKDDYRKRYVSNKRNKRGNI